MRKPLMWASKIKRLVFFGTLDNFTFKVYRRREWEAGVLHGIEYEEQRIIKLLETNYKGPNGLLWTERDLRSLIALIKGEN